MSATPFKLRAGELKQFDRAGIVVVAVRLALRVEPFVRQENLTVWRSSVDAVVLAPAEPLPAEQAAAMARQLSDISTLAVSRGSTAMADVCGKSAGDAVVGALDVAAAIDRPAAVKAVIATASYAGNIPAKLAHDGFTDERSHRSGIDAIAGAYWDAVREDHRVIAPLLLPNTVLTLAQITALAPLDGMPTVRLDP